MARAQKVSVAIDREVLAAAKRSAAAEGLSLSALMMNLLGAHLAREERLENMDRFVREYTPNAKISAKEVQAIRDEMNAPLKPIRRGRRKREA